MYSNIKDYFVQFQLTLPNHPFPNSLMYFNLLLGKSFSSLPINIEEMKVKGMV